MEKDDDLNSSKDSTYNLVKRLCEKRINGFQYMKRLHLGGLHFFNTVKIAKEDLVAFYPNSKMNKRSGSSLVLHSPFYLIFIFISILFFFFFFFFFFYLFNEGRCSGFSSA